MYIWIHDKYSSTSFKQRLWQKKIVLIWQNYFFQIVCVSVVQWSKSCLHVRINRVRLPATLFSVFCTVFFFPVWSLFLKLFFLLAFFSKKVFVLYEAYFFPFKLEAFIFLMIVKSLLYGYWLSFMSFRAYRNIMNR